jgi:hypothetical protein
VAVLSTTCLPPVTHVSKPQFFDPVRGKNVRALPEELVRHQLVEWLVGVVGVPRRLVAVEYPLSNLDPRSRKRADVVVWQPSENDGGMRAWLLAECKAPSVRLSIAVADQVRGYAEKIRAEFVLLTNGNEVRIFRRVGSRYGEVEGVPLFSTIAGNTEQ